MKYIETNGQSLPVNFGMNALSDYCERFGLLIDDLQKLSEGLTLKRALSLMYCGLKDGHRIEKKEFNLTVEDVGDMMDADKDLMTKIMQVFTSSIAPPPPDAEQLEIASETPEQKKK